jgi:hypothetical protein
MKSLVRVVLALLVSAAVLMVPSSAEARQSRHYAWGSWWDPTFQVKVREDGYFTPGTKSAWQFQRGHKHGGKRQVRVIARTWYFDADTFGPWTVGPWKKLRPGDKRIVKGPLVFGCFNRDGRIGAQQIAQVRKRGHHGWSAPRDLGTSTGTFALDC